MKIKIVLDSSSNVNILKEAKYCVLEISEVQNEFTFELVLVDWIDEITNERGVIDYDIVYERKIKEFGDEAVVIITPNKLKKGMLAEYKKSFYMFTFANWKGMNYVPPLRTLFAEYIACICSSFACNLSVEESDRMTFDESHEETPKGCISDYCPRGNRDVLISMTKAHICDVCKAVYRKNGCQDSILFATEQILNYVKSETSLCTQNSPYDAFMSHSSKDKPFVHTLVDKLEKERIKVWIDEKEILPGEVFLQKITEGIKKSSTFLYIISESSLSSGWVTKELNQAATLQAKGEITTIIPILIEKFDVPDIIMEFNYLELVDKLLDEDKMSRLIKSIRIAREESDKKIKGKKKGKNK